MPPNFLLKHRQKGESLAKHSRHQVSRLRTNNGDFGLLLVMTIFALTCDFSPAIRGCGLVFVSGCTASHGMTCHVSSPSASTFLPTGNSRYRQRRRVRSGTTAFGFYFDRATLLASVPPVRSSFENRKSTDFRFCRSRPPFPDGAFCPLSRIDHFATRTSIPEVSYRPTVGSDDIPVNDESPLSTFVGPLNWVSTALTHYFYTENTTPRILRRTDTFSDRNKIIPTYRSFPSFMFWWRQKPMTNRIVSSLSCSSRDSLMSTVHEVSDSASTAVNVNTTSLGSVMSSSNEISKMSSSSSVHLQLISPTLPPQSDKLSGVDKASSNDVLRNEMNGTSNDSTPAKSPTTTSVTVHTYHDASTNQTWKGLNVSHRKFRAYLQYCNVWNNETSGSVTRSLSRTEPPPEAHIETKKHVILSSSSNKQSSASSSTTEKDEVSASFAKTLKSDNVNAAGKDTSDLRIETARLRDEWRSYWKIRRLITDRTELLAVYPSDEQQQSNIEKNLNATTDKSNEASENALSNLSNTVKKRGGFADLLLLYTDRLMAILNDERESDRISLVDCSVDQTTTMLNQSAHQSMSSQPSVNLVEWLEANYGKQETMDLEFESFQALDEVTKLAKLKHFLVWFRSQFPYFYDRCDACGASIKEDSAAIATTGSTETPAVEASASSPDATNENEMDDDSSEANDSEHQTFVGYIYPSDSELIGKASRTELYQCHKCFSFTRFPRYNTAKHILSQRRGRCGEYSMILFRFLRALNHECRWVVDWADHVWAELLLLSNGTASAEASRWVHLDPCEAAVDENFIYQDWGKKQNFIMGFYLPPAKRMQESLAKMLTESCGNESAMNASIPLIEDITSSYTREPWEDVCQRRNEPEVHIQTSVVKATHELQRKLLECYNFTMLSKEDAVR